MSSGDVRSITILSEKNGSEQPPSDSSFHAVNTVASGPEIAASVLTAPLGDDDFQVDESELWLIPTLAQKMGRLTDANAAW